ncbi:MAG: hypothetical protein RQ743_11405 [Bacteroidales bacterium]|nr:hypothetical protein [Bacteroidales bacterium]
MVIILPLPGLPFIGKLFDKNLVPQNEFTDPSADRFIEELTWYMEAFREGRQKGTPY